MTDDNKVDPFALLASLFGGADEEDIQEENEALQDAWSLLAATLYDRLMEYVSDARYSKVSRLAEAMATIQDELEMDGVPAGELAFRQAGALARLGNLQRALEIVEPLKQSFPEGPAMYCGRLAAVYSNAGDLEHEREFKEKALQLAPDSVDCIIDLADFLAWQSSETRYAEELVRRVATPPSLVHESFRLKVWGILALRAGEFGKALARFEQSLDVLGTMAPDSSILVGHVRLLRCFKAFAMAKAGRREEALYEFQELRGFLFRCGERKLLALLDEEFPEVTKEVYGI